METTGMAKKNLAKLAAIGIGAAAFGIAIDSHDIARVNAEGETVEESKPVEVNSTTETESVDSAVSESSYVAPTSADSASTDVKDTSKEPWYEPALKWIDNKIVPLLGSVSVVSILGAITSVATAIAKRKGDKKTQLTITLQDVKITQLENTVTELKQHEEEMLANYQNVLDSASQTMQLTANYAKTQADLIAEQNMKVESVYKMKDCIDISCRLIAKSLALSDTAVKSGIAKDAQELIESLKRIESEGNGGE